MSNNLNKKKLKIKKQNHLTKSKLIIFFLKKNLKSNLN